MNWLRPLVWLLRVLVFFTLFAFALNNQHDVTVHWFFGHQWRAPMVFIVLGAFGIGSAVGVLAMTPAWWRKRRLARAAKVHGVTDAHPEDASVMSSLNAEQMGYNGPRANPQEYPHGH